MYLSIVHSSFSIFYLFRKPQASISNVVEWHHEHNPQTIKLFHQEENSRVQLANDWHEIAKAVSYLIIPYLYYYYYYYSIFYFDSTSTSIHKSCWYYWCSMAEESIEFLTFCFGLLLLLQYLYMPLFAQTLTSHTQLHDPLPIEE